MTFAAKTFLGPATAELLDVEFVGAHAASLEKTVIAMVLDDGTKLHLTVSRDVLAKMKSLLVRHAEQRRSGMYDDRCDE
jgi:hypothetical protein